MHYDEDAQQFSLAAEEEATVTEAAKEVKMMVANFMLNVYWREWPNGGDDAQDLLWEQ